MLYDIKLEISYAYTAPSDRSRNVLRLMPADNLGDQRVISRLLALDPLPDERHDDRDFFGNAVVTAVWHEPVASSTFSLTARVERPEMNDRLDTSVPLSKMPEALFAERSIAAGSPHHFVAPSPRIQPDHAMTDYARSVVTPDMSALQAVQALGHALHRDMTFDPTVTTVDTPASEAFANRHGVCQDFAHIMITCLRSLGIPAGYMSGFLRTFPPPGQPRLEGADAMHAWVRAWCGQDMGWVEFDPTNDQPAGRDYISVAFGRDYDDVAPVRGVMRGAGGQSSSQAVDVIPLDGDSAT